MDQCTSTNLYKLFPTIMQQNRSMQASFGRHVKCKTEYIAIYMTHSKLGGLQFCSVLNTLTSWYKNMHDYNQECILL